jgi:hypothetical protein
MVPLVLLLKTFAISEVWIFLLLVTKTKFHHKLLPTMGNTGSEGQGLALDEPGMMCLSVWNAFGFCFKPLQYHWIGDQTSGG